MNVSDHSQIELQAAEWIARRDGAGWDDLQQGRLDAWLAQSTAHRVAFLRLSATWSRADRLAAIRDPRGVSRYDSRRLPGRPVLRLAASMAAVALLAALSWAVFVRPDSSTYATAVGEQKTVSLADGSRVEINTNTRVSARMAQQRRTVVLEQGEAYFEVAPDAARPFVVVAGDYQVTALGTKFSVRRVGERLRVVVTEGRVRIDDRGRSLQLTPTVVHAGDVAASTHEATIVMKLPQRKLAQSLSWRRGRLIFEQQTLAEVAEEFNRYNEQKVVLADAKTAAMRIGGSFLADNVEAFAQLLREAFGLKVQIREDEILISS